MPLVVSEADISISNGVDEVGTPSAIGLGVNTARVPPNGATLCVFGSELASIITRFDSVARSR